LEKQIEACPDKPNRPKAPAGWDWSYIFGQTKTTSPDAWNISNAPLGSKKVGLPSADGLVNAAAIPKIGYLVADADSASTATTADMGHIFGRFGQGPDTIPGSRLAWAPISITDVATAGMMVSVLPDNNSITDGLSAATSFVTFEMQEVPFYNGLNGASDKAFKPVSLNNVNSDYKWDNYCAGAASLAGSVLTLAAVAASLY